jgi:hypothetical protein
METWRVVWPLVPAGLIALLVCWADYTWAGTARSAAAVIHKTFESSRRTVWFHGHWGFQYYMETAGGKAVDFTHLEIAKEDIIIVPINNTCVDPPAGETIRLYQIFKFAPYQKLATMNLQLGAGFYSDRWGPLPFVAGSVDPEEYCVCIPVGNVK